MPLYLLEATYSVEGYRGLIKDGGSKRRDVAMEIVARAGGRLLTFHFGLGEPDVIAIAEFPDAVMAGTLSLAIAASGAATVRVRTLLTPEEIDKTTRRIVPYAPPGT